MNSTVEHPNHYATGKYECLEVKYKEIPGYPNYLACSNGTIWSKKTNRILKSSIDPKTGYHRVSVTNDGGVSKTCYIHRLIAIAFLANNEQLPQVNHKNENKSDNSVKNLEWCTAKYNSNYGTKNDRVKASYGIERMRKNIRLASKNLKKQVECLETGIIYDSISQASISVTGKRHKNNGSNITRSCKDGNKAYGYHWKYVYE